MELAEPAELFADTAKTLSCGLSFWLSHLGHLALSWPKTRVSNSCWHSWQMYSKIGMKIAPLEMDVPIRIKLWKLRKLTSQIYFALVGGDAWDFHQELSVETG